MLSLVVTNVSIIILLPSPLPLFHLQRWRPVSIGFVNIESRLSETYCPWQALPVPSISPSKLSPPSSTSSRSEQKAYRRQGPPYGPYQKITLENCLTSPPRTSYTSSSNSNRSSSHSKQKQRRNQKHAPRENDTAVPVSPPDINYIRGPVASIPQQTTPSDIADTNTIPQARTLQDYAMEGYTIDSQGHAHDEESTWKATKDLVTPSQYLCRVCTTKGHGEYNCPCYECIQCNKAGPGHSFRDCPRKRCHICKSLDHLARNCTHDKGYASDNHHLGFGDNYGSEAKHSIDT